MYQFKVCKLRKRGKSKRRLKINFFINRQFVASFLNVEIASVSTITIVSHIVLDLCSSFRYFRKRAWHDSKATLITWISCLLCLFQFYKMCFFSIFDIFLALFDHLWLFLTVSSPFFSFFLMIYGRFRQFLALFTSNYHLPFNGLNGAWNVVLGLVEAESNNSWLPRVPIWRILYKGSCKLPPITIPSSLCLKTLA